MTPTISACSTLELVVKYDTSPPEQDVFGLGFTLHWSSQALTFVRVENGYEPGQVGPLQLQDDVDDRDGDPETDKRLNASWLDVEGTWPDHPLPIDLYTVVFTATPGFSGTTLRFVDIAGPAGFAFDAPPLNVTAATDALDVDGNGTAQPFSDGLLLLRYLFGFRGDVLVDSVIGAGCCRCTADQVESHLESLL